MRVLITGANSFIGTNFRKFSIYKEIDEISLIENKPENINFSKYDVVLHLAAITHQSRSIPENVYYDVNRDLCLRVAECAKKAEIKQFVFLSTIKVYGSAVPDLELRNEDSICQPDDDYGRSKLGAEIGLKKLENDSFIVSIIRTPPVYGEVVKGNMIKIVKLVDTIPILPFGRIKNRRNFTYVENLVGFIDRIIEKRASGIFIAKDDGAFSTTELVIVLSKYLEKKIILFRLPEICVRIGTFFVPGIFKRLYDSLEFNNDKTLKELNYKPTFSTEYGLKKMVLSYKDQNKDICMDVNH